MPHTAQSLCHDNAHDDLLFFVLQDPAGTGSEADGWQLPAPPSPHKADAPGMPFIVRRRAKTLPAELQIAGSLFPQVNWRLTTLLNFVLHSLYQLTVVSCRQSALASVANGGYDSEGSLAVCKEVYASPTRTLVNLSGAKGSSSTPTPSYPNICFAVDNFEDAFDGTVLHQLDDCFCVVLHALVEPPPSLPSASPSPAVHTAPRPHPPAAPPSQQQSQPQHSLPSAAPLNTDTHTQPRLAASVPQYPDSSCPSTSSLYPDTALQEQHPEASTQPPSRSQPAPSLPGAPQGSNPSLVHHDTRGDAIGGDASQGPNDEGQDRSRAPGISTSSGLRQPLGRGHATASQQDALQDSRPHTVPPGSVAVAAAHSRTKLAVAPSPGLAGRLLGAVLGNSGQGSARAEHVSMVGPGGVGRAEVAVAVSNAQWAATAAGADSGVGGADAQGRVNMVQRVAGLFRNKAAGEQRRCEGPAGPSTSLQCSLMTMELPVESIALSILEATLKEGRAQS
ncbi:MAG: hypothetical protein WDW36_005904 [Sanguina aurantia]